jgi:hypothetical protein
LFCRVVKGCGPVPFKKCSTLIYSETSSNHGIISWLTSLCVATIFNTYRPLITLWKPFLSASLNNRKQPMEQAKGLVGQKWSLPKSYLNNGLWPPGYIYYILYIIYILSTNWFSMGFNVLTIKNSDRGSHRSRGSRAVKVYQ